MHSVEAFTQVKELHAAPLTRKSVFRTRLRSNRRSGSTRRSVTSSLITTPVLTELVRLSLSTSSLASAKTATAGSHLLGSHLVTQGVPGLLVQYSILCALLASLGGWVVQFTGYLWHSLFEDYVIRNKQLVKAEENQIYGVDVTNSRFFADPRVQEAVTFAAQAHKGQTRKTREPYVAHCVAAACIVEELLELAEDSNLSNSRAEATIIAALLHDVLDDTSVKAQQVEEQFGSDVVHMVAQVSQLSSMNQLLRRRRRQMSGQSRGLNLSKKEEEQLRTFILSMVSEPLVLVIKLADRLHNMRTVFALKKDKQKAVATETLQVWCGLAERLGMMALKAELEDLCFAVLQPTEYTLLRNELDSIWGVQQVTDLVPTQADSLFRQAQANIKLATQTADLNAYPTPRLPPPAHVPRPSVTPAGSPSEAEASSTESASSKNQTEGQSMQSTPGDLYAHAEHGVTRSPSHVTLNVRQQKALESGLLKLSRVDQRSSSPAAVLEKPTTTAVAPSAQTGKAAASTSSSSSFRHTDLDITAVSSASSLPATKLSTVADSQQERVSSNSNASTSSTSASSSSLSKSSSNPSELPSRPVPRGVWTGLGNDPSKTEQVTPAEIKTNGPKRVIRGRSARQAMAAEARARANSGSKASTSGREPDFAFLSCEQQQAKRLVSSVLPFSAMGFKNHRAVPANAARLEVLQGCARLLLIEIQREGYAAGLKVSVQGRVKSLYSIYNKMMRKTIPMRQVYDARALRVIVDDEGGTRTADAWAAAYRIQPAVHRLWRKVGGEYDDYIINPKRSGYQSLHTAVMGPGGVPIEVQIRTAQMHEQAEYGDAAHWAYKENTPKLAAPGKIQEKQPVVCLTNGRMRYGVVYSILKDGLQFLAVVSADSVMPAAEQSSETIDYFLHLYEYAHRHSWFRPGHGDLHASLELYSKCQDGRFRREDHTGYKMPAYCTPLEAWAGQTALGASDNSNKESNPASLGSVQLAQQQPQTQAQTQLEPQTSSQTQQQPQTQAQTQLEPQTSSQTQQQPQTKAQMQAQQQLDRVQSQTQAQVQTQQQTQRALTQKIRFLRTMLEWRNEVTSDLSQQPNLQLPTGVTKPGIAAPDSQQGAEVMILIWPAGDFVRLPRGTTAGQIVHDQGWANTSGDEHSRLVNVNNRLVPENTVLEDGDYLVFSRELLTI